MELIRYRRAVLAGAFAAACAAAGCTSTSTSATAPSANKCQVSAAASPMQFTATGGSGTLTVSASRDCTWSVSPQANWIALSGPTNGNGDASIQYTVAHNTVPSARAADLVVESQRIQLSQAAAPCTYSLDRSSDTAGAAGGTLTVQLTTISGCSWTTASDAGWLTFDGATSGTTSSAVHVVVAANAGAARSADVTIGGRTYTVSQEAAAVTPGPSPSPSPSPTPTPTPAPTPTPTPTPVPTPISLSGTVDSVTGSCPSLQFSLSGRTVTADRDTTYRNGRCRDLSDGDTVTVDGTLQTSGIVTADRISIDKNVK